MIILHFLNYLTSIIYAASLKGVSARSSGGYYHLFGFRHEEDYEDGPEALNDAAQYSSHVEAKRTSLQSKLKAEQGIIRECLQGDLLYRCKQSTESSLTPSPVNKQLHHKKPLLKHKAYSTFKNWMCKFYDKQFILHNMSKNIGKQIRSSYKLLNFGKFIWENSGKLMILVFTTQVAAAQAFHNTTQMDLASAGNATDSFSMIPLLAANEASFNMMPKNTPDLSEIHQNVEISEGLLQKILHKSDVIINDLEELTNFLSANNHTNRHPEKGSNSTTLPRVVRSLSLEESFMCEIEQDTLISLRNELQVTLEQHNEGGSNNCQLNFDTDMCEELIKLVQCGYSHLRNGFLAARKKMSEAINMGNKFAEFKEKYTTLLDSIDMSHSQEYNMMKTKLEAEVQEQNNMLNVWISSLKEQKIKSCISEISSGKIESAMQDFKSFNDDSVLPNIIRSVYSEYGNLSQIHNIVKFISKLPGCASGRKAYLLLFDEMHKNNQLSSPNVLIVDFAARGCMGETFMKPYVRDVIDTWAPKVRINKDNAQIKDFARKHGYGFRAILPDLIEKAYANELSNVENIINFVCELPHMADWAIGYSSLFYKMRSNKHIDSYQTVMIASRVKEYMDMPNYPGLIEKYKDIFNTLRRNMPKSVKGLIWSDRNGCTIFNVHYGEYLYAANDYFNYAAYTWVEGVEVTSSDWQLNVRMGGKYFEIKNTHYNRFLFSPEKKFSSQRRHVRTGTNRDFSDAYWMLEPEGENFLIRSRSHDNYLYADSKKKGSDRRFVFGWTPRSIPDSVKRERMWRIDCVTKSLWQIFGDSTEDDSE